MIKQQAGATAEDPTPERLRRLAWLLDESIPLPGGFRVGIDGLIGLLPIVGDLFGAWATGTIMMEAQRAGASKVLLMRMGGNLLIDTVLGAVPLVGDLFDFGFKANSRNLKLLRELLADRQRAEARSRGFVWLLVLGLALSVVGLIALGVMLGRALSASFSG